jgi:hypothetical protein
MKRAANLLGLGPWVELLNSLLIINWPFSIIILFPAILQSRRAGRLSKDAMGYFLI